MTSRYKIIFLAIVFNFTINAAQLPWDHKLFLAAANGKIQMVQEVLNMGVSIDSCNPEGRTSLHMACAEGHPEVVKFLLEHKAKLEIASTMYSYTPLFEAIERDSFEIVKILVDGRANVRAKTREGFHNTLTWSCKAKTEIVKLLLDCGMDVNKVSQYARSSALIYTLLNGKIQNSLLLISYGADLKLIDDENRVPIDMINAFNDEKKIREAMKSAKEEFEQSLAILSPPVRRIIIGYFGTNTYLEYENPENKLGKG